VNRAPVSEIYTMMLNSTSASDRLSKFAVTKLLDEIQCSS